MLSREEALPLGPVTPLLGLLPDLIYPTCTGEQGCWQQCPLPMGCLTLTSCQKSRNVSMFWKCSGLTKVQRALPIGSAPCETHLQHKGQPRQLYDAGSPV